MVSSRFFFPVDFPLNQSIDTNVGNVHHKGIEILVFR